MTQENISVPGSTEQQAEIYQVLESLGYDQQDFSPEDWARLVEYYQEILAEGGDIEGVLPDFDLATAAGPMPSSVQGVNPLVLGMAQSFSPSGPQLGGGAVAGTSYQPPVGGQNGQPDSDGQADDEAVAGLVVAEVVEEVVPIPLVGSPGSDTIQGGDSPEIITAGGGNDTIDAGGGDDVIEMDDLLTQRDVIDGGDGYDTLRFTDNGGNKNDLRNVTNVEEIVLGDATSKIKVTDALVSDGEVLTVDAEGLDSSHTLNFDGRAELDGRFDISSGEGNDTIRGGAQDDTIQGGGGKDRLYGQDGDDTLAGDAGNDKLYGGEGNDMLDGGIGNDSLYGNEGADSILGGEGKDKLYGNDGNDSLFGGEGRDSLYGHDGNDVMEGGAGADFIRGYDGDDFILGGTGADTLVGNAGSDTFRYEGLDEGGDRVNGFVSADDVFEFASAAFDASAGFSSSRINGYDGTNAGLGNNDASFIFDERNGNLWYDENGDDAGGQTLIADVNGDDVLDVDISVI